MNGSRSFFATPDAAVSIARHGAAGDGVTDDLAAIQATIDAVQGAGGGTVLIPAGRYVVSGCPQITGGDIIVRGVGRESEIVLAPAAMTPSGVTLGLWVNGASNVLIEDLAIDGNFAGVAKNGSYANSAPLWTATVAAYGAQTVKNYQYSGSGVDFTTYLQYRSCVRITDSSNVTVRGCWLHDSIGSGVLIDGSAVGATTDVMVRDCRVWMTWDNGVYFHKGVDHGSATGNHCSDTQYAGVTAIYCRHITISGNQCRNTGPSASDSAGIEMCAVDHGLVSGNVIDNALFCGIQCKVSDETNITGGEAGRTVRNRGLLISGNSVSTVRHPNYPANIAVGVDLDGSDDTTVEGNQISDADYGVSVGARAIRVAVRGNTIRDCRAWGVQVGDSLDVVGTVVAGNLITGCGGNGITGIAPATYTDNVILGNGGEGIDLPAVTGMPKTDVVRGNYIADNAQNGVAAHAGAGSLAVVVGNEFTNTEVRVVTDGVITASSTTLTSATAAFTADDAGAVIVVLGAAGSSGQTSLVTTIASQTSATAVVLGAAPTVTRTGVSVMWQRGRQFFVDGVMTSGNPALASATAKFTAADVGRAITLFSGDGPGASVLWSGTVTAWVSATQVTLSASPANSTGIAFLIQRAIGRQARALYVSGGTDVHFLGNVSSGMRTENYPAYALTSSSLVRGNTDFGSATSNQEPAAAIVTPIDGVNYTSYPGAHDAVRKVDASGGARDVVLPDAGGVKGQWITVVRISAGANAVTVATTGADTINGVSTVTLSSQWSAVTVVSDGDNWFKVATV